MKSFSFLYRHPGFSFLFQNVSICYHFRPTTTTSWMRDPVAWPESWKPESSSAGQRLAAGRFEKVDLVLTLTLEKLT